MDMPTKFAGGLEGWYEIKKKKEEEEIKNVSNCFAQATGTIGLFYLFIFFQIGKTIRIVG